MGKVKIDDFELGKYPVTNSWFREFMEAGGYKNKEYWTDEGWKWRKKNGLTEPRYWHSRRWNCPNAPVVGVSWYEVVAFTNWLTGTLDDGYTYRLPTEQEWQAAAAGRKGNKYPWGNEWDKNKCNNVELRLDKTTSVGVFLSGNTPENDPDRMGIFADMAGNVWEWVASKYDKETYTLRGGAWNYYHDICRCAMRGRLDPCNRSFILGFRCARTLTL